MLSISLALGVGLGTEAAGVPPLPPPAETIVVTTPDNQIEVISGADPVEIIVTAPAIYAGTYSVLQADLAAGPVNLVPPQLSVAAEVGESMGYTPGLWAFDAARGSVLVAGQWLRDDVDIAGATGTSYDVQEADLETQLRVREVAMQIGQTAQVQVSTPVSIDRRTLVFSLIGQSNMVGFAAFDGGAGYPAQAFQVARTGRISGGTNDEIVPAQTLLDHHDGAANFMGLAVQFAIDHMAAHPYDRVLLVPDARSSTSFAANHWNRGNAFYNSAVARLNTLFAANPDYEFCGFLWHQGESDAGSAADAAAYAGRLDQMITDMRADVSVATATTPFVVGGMVPDWVAGDANRQTVQAALSDTPNRVGYTAFVTSGGLVPQADGIHFDAGSLRLLGARYFTVLEALRAGLPPDPGTGWQIEGSVIQSGETPPAVPDIDGTVVLEGN